jgi:hypothetical protein
VGNKRPQFQLIRLVATPASLAALEKAGVAPLALVSRHVTGDYGDLSSDDKQANVDALKDGSRILSAYELSTGERLYVITDAENERGHRECTTVMLCSEY